MKQYILESHTLICAMNRWILFAHAISNRVCVLSSVMITFKVISKLIWMNAVLFSFNLSIVWMNESAHFPHQIENVWTFQIVEVCPFFGINSDSIAITNTTIFRHIWCISKQSNQKFSKIDFPILNSWR